MSTTIPRWTLRSFDDEGKETFSSVTHHDWKAAYYESERFLQKGAARVTIERTFVNETGKVVHYLKNGLSLCSLSLKPDGGVLFPKDWPADHVWDWISSGNGTCAVCLKRAKETNERG